LKSQQLSINPTSLPLPLLLQVENALQVEGQRIPNLTHPDVPIGEEDNATVLSLVSAAAAAAAAAGGAVG
jgi:seryl-tRNA synthetase